VVKRRAALLVFIALATGAARADVLHLKDGRSIPVESWEYRGDQVVFEIPAGSVTIPRSLVLRVEATTPSQAAKPAVTPAPVGEHSPRPSPRPEAKPSPRITAKPPIPADWTGLSVPEMQRAVETLKREARDPQRREQASRQAALGLSILAAKSAEAGDLAAAQGLFGEALTYDPRCLPALIGLSAAYLREGKDHYARSQLEEALLSFPKDPTLHYLMGEVHYTQENLHDAISEWETSLNLKQDSRVAARLEKAKREFSVDEGFERKDTAHFTFRYDESGSVSPGLASSLRDYLEESYRELSDRFQFAPSSPVTVVLYATREFHQVTQEPASVSGLFDGKIRVPLGGLKTMSPPLRAVLVHELTHAFVAGKSGGNCPRWLQEGLAQMQEGRSLSPGQERALARDLAASEGRSWYDDFSYPSSLSFTLYLTQKYSFAVVLQALDRMKSGVPPESAVGEAAGDSFEEIQKAWVAGLVQPFAEGR